MRNQDAVRQNGNTGTARKLTAAFESKNTHPSKQACIFVTKTKNPKDRDFDGTSSKQVRKGKTRSLLVRFPLRFRVLDSFK